MKIEFLWRQPGNHHVIRREDGAQPIPRTGDIVVIGERGYTVREVLWIRGDNAVQISLD